MGRQIPERQESQRANGHSADRRGIVTDETTERIIACAYSVSNALGVGFLEKVYENALAYELRQAGLRVLQQHQLKVRYRGVVVGEYAVDLLVEDSVLVELKAAKGVEEVFLAQCLNYLRASGRQVCLLLNFGTPKLQVRRIVHGFDDRKKGE
jgi:GxxExxY protein